MLTQYLQQKLCSFGYPEASVAWSIGYTQGDHVEFHSDLDHETLLRRLIAPLSISHVERLQRAIDAGMVSITRARSGHGSSTVEWEINDDTIPDLVDLTDLVQDYVALIKDDADDWCSSTYRLLADAMLSGYTNHPEQQTYRRSQYEIVFTAVSAQEFSDAFEAHDEAIDDGFHDCLDDTLTQLASGQWILRDVVCDIFEIDSDGEPAREPIGTDKSYGVIFPATDRTFGGTRRDLLREALANAGLSRDERTNRTHQRAA